MRDFKYIYVLSLYFNRSHKKNTHTHTENTINYKPHILLNYDNKEIKQHKSFSFYYYYYYY